MLDVVATTPSNPFGAFVVVALMVPKLRNDFCCRKEKWATYFYTLIFKDFPSARALSGPPTRSTPQCSWHIRCRDRESSNGPSSAAEAYTRKFCFRRGWTHGLRLIPLWSSS